MLACVMGGHQKPFDKHGSEKGATEGSGHSPSYRKYKHAEPD